MHLTRRIFPIVLCLAVIVTSSCTERGADSSNDKLSAAVTIDALYEIAAAVGGDTADIIKIIPDGAEAHGFEPKAKDLIALENSQLLIRIGLGLEPWADNAVSAVGHVTVITVSDGIVPIELGGGAFDPHVWLSTKNAAVIAQNIRDAFIAADTENSETYTVNCSSFIAELTELSDKYDPKLRESSGGIIVTSHRVLGYLCRDFNLTQKAVQGVFNEGEPRARELAELIDFCLENNIKTVFAEVLSNSLAADTLSRETGAAVEKLYTIEGAEDGLSYIERMEHNLDAITRSLG